MSYDRRFSLADLNNPKLMISSISSQASLSKCLFCTDGRREAMHPVPTWYLISSSLLYGTFLRLEFGREGFIEGKIPVTSKTLLMSTAVINFYAYNAQAGIKLTLVVSTFPCRTNSSLICRRDVLNFFLGV